jgi:hypothetical protein
MTSKCQSEFESPEGIVKCEYRDPEHYDMHRGTSSTEHLYWWTDKKALVKVS